jgi:epoxyqueuosine reductase
VLGAADLARLDAIAHAHGLTHTGVAPATVMQRARSELFRRRDQGLHDGMRFTYKNPERSTDPGRAVPEARAVYVAARPYLLDEQVDQIDKVGPVGPTVRMGVGGDDNSVAARVARYAWTDHYGPLRDGLRAVAGELRRQGWKAVAFADDNSIVDREIAYLAGIGWFGKNANLLLPGAGSFFVLGCVITTAPLPVADRVVADGCGSCRRCLDGCPTGAIVAPGVVDGARCLAWLLQKPGTFPVEFRRALGDRIYGCDDCQEVCPPTVRLGHRHPAPTPTGAIEAHIDVLDLLEADDDEVLARWGRWYLADREVRWLRRNALIVVGNTADPGNERARGVLAQYRDHPDPILREHAEWAAAQIEATL